MLLSFCFSVFIRAATRCLYVSRSDVGSFCIAVSASSARSCIQFSCLVCKLYFRSYGSRFISLLENCISVLFIMKGFLLCFWLTAILNVFSKSYFFLFRILLKIGPLPKTVRIGCSWPRQAYYSNEPHYQYQQQHTPFIFFICNCLLGILLKLNPYQCHGLHWLVKTGYT